MVDVYEQKVHTLSFDGLVKMYQENAKFVLIDARSREDYDKKHLPGAVETKIENFTKKLRDLYGAQGRR